MMNDLPVVKPAPERPSGNRGRMENAVDKLAAMMGQEQTSYGPTLDYLNYKLDDPSYPLSERVNEGWRRRICEWSFEVADHFGFDRNAVSHCLSYVDRVIANTTKATGKPIERREFQLVAVTSLFLALKLHGETGADIKDGNRRKLRIDAFVELSRGLFQIDALEKMERCIVVSLDWHLNPPTYVDYLASYLDLLPESPPELYNEDTYPEDTACKIFETARYLTELSVCVSKFSFRFNPSLVAYSAILCAMEALKEVEMPDDVSEAFLANMAWCTTLTPRNLQVRECRSMLKEICPAMFEPEEPAVPPPVGAITRSESISSTASNDITLGASGKVSPVSIVDDPNRQRKRGRDTDEI